MKEKISKLVNVYRKSGFIGFWKKLYAYVVANYLNKISFDVMLRPDHYRAEIRRMLLDRDFDRVVLWRSSFGYDVPLYQRPQHISRNLAKNGCLVLYEVTTMTDQVKTLTKRHGNLWLFNFNNLALRRLLMEELKQVRKPKYVQLYSTDWKLSVGDIRFYTQSGFGFIYEYIDHISPELAGTATLPLNISQKYDYVMSHDDVYVVTTADLLYQDVVSQRGVKRLVYSSNGVDYAFFRDLDPAFQLDADFQRIVDLGKPVVCYYGALAKWFDYDLVKKIAAEGKYSVVLFGIKYDESFDENLPEPVENLYFLGTRDYHVLKYYANAADVLVIPFRITDITRSTNPVKVFEYMALQKPIVTTDMNECHKYSSILIGENHEDFLQKLDQAMALRQDADYLALLDREARENDWSYKARAIVNMIRVDEES